MQPARPLTWPNVCVPFTLLRYEPTISSTLWRSLGPSRLVALFISCIEGGWTPKTWVLRSIRAEKVRAAQICKRSCFSIELTPFIAIGLLSSLRKRPLRCCGRMANELKPDVTTGQVSQLPPPARSRPRPSGHLLRYLSSSLSLSIKKWVFFCSGVKVLRSRNSWDSRFLCSSKRKIKNEVFWRRPMEILSALENELVTILSR